MIPPPSTATSDPGADRREEESLEGTVLDGRYLVGELLGTGGMGRVYAGQHLGLRREVAIKALRPQWSLHPELEMRLAREARALGALDHPNVVEVHDFHRDPLGTLFLVMERLHGRFVDRLLREHLRLPLRLALEIARQVSLGLAAAHRQGLVHRDLKADNVHVALRGGWPEGSVDLDGLDLGRVQAKVVDFGIVQPELMPGPRLTQAGLILGTPESIAPEQIVGAPVDHRADLYGLGVLIFEMLAGVPPFVGETPMHVLAAHLGETPPEVSTLCPEVPPRLDGLVSKLLQKRPEDRPASLSAVTAELETLLRGGERLTATQAAVPKRRHRSSGVLEALAGELCVPAGVPADPAGPSSGAPREPMVATAATTAAVVAAVAPAALVAPARQRAGMTRALAVLAGALAVLLLALGVRAVTGEGPAGGARAPAQPAAARVAPVAVEVAAPVPSVEPPAVTAVVAEGAPALPPVAAAAAAQPAQTAPAREPAPRVPRAATLRAGSEIEDLHDAATIALVQGRFQAAARLFERVLELSPRYARAYRGAGLALAEIGDTSAAVASLRRYLQLAPGASDARRIRARLHALELQLGR